MGYEWVHEGSVQLKAGSTLEHVLNLFPDEDGNDPRLPLRSEGEVELLGGDVWIKVESGFLEYRASGDRGVLDDQVTEFLEAVARERAVEGWIDYQVEDFQVAYGPSEFARAEAKLISARGALRSAQSAVAAAEEELLGLQRQA